MSNEHDHDRELNLSKGIKATIKDLCDLYECTEQEFLHTVAVLALNNPGDVSIDFFIGAVYGMLGKPGRESFEELHAQIHTAIELSRLFHELKQRGNMESFLKFGHDEFDRHQTWGLN